MNPKNANRQAASQSTNAERQRPERREGAGAHQEGPYSEQAGQTNRRAPGDNQKHERAIRQEGQTPNNEQKGGDRSNRAAHSGATGERHPSGGQNKPEPKNQDEKGMGRPRNR